MSNLGKAFSNRQFTGTLLFVLLLYAFEEWLFNSPQRDFFKLIATFRSQNEIMLASLSGIVSFIYCFLFVWVALGSTWPFRFLYIILFTLPMLVQYGFWKAVGRFMSMPDLQIATATPLSTWLGADALFFNWHFIVPSISFFLLLVFIKGTLPGKKSLIAFASVFFFTLLTGLVYHFSTNNSTLSLGPSLSSFYQTSAQFIAEDLLPSKREILAPAKHDLPQNNIILVIDESIRGDHLSINGYERETTPFLDSLSLQNDFHNWGLAVAGATCSYPSNSLILTGVRPGLDEFNQSKQYPTLFQFAKTMGYTTSYMDAQTNSLWNGLTSQDFVYVDHWYKAVDFGEDYQSDLRAADLITQIVAGKTGNFIVLNKRGVHFLYEGSYPPENTIWTPIPNDYTRQPELVKNPYDNGIRYNVNSFFEHLLADLSLLDNTFILYTSDHGQTLFKDHVNWLHCNSTREEATVPLFILGRDLPPTDTQFHASHSNILPTILELMNIPLSQQIHSYASSLLSSTADMNTDRFFFTGSLDLIQFPYP
jgi:glucan phosphoethanolaminetransferase (alkaline phosphatase superfamily)